jgi:cyclic lactone autoinducer peptide
MKQKIAVLANALLITVGSFLVFTNTVFLHRPETPEEFLK